MWGGAFHEAYPSGKEWHFPLQLLGLDVWRVGIKGFNPTWWFMDAIVPLYLMFPVLYGIVSRSVVMSLLLGMTVAVIPVISAEQCIFPFIVGIVAERINLFERVLSGVAQLKVLVGTLVACVLGMVFMTSHHDGGGFGAFAVMALFVVYSHLPNALRAGIGYLGRHSMNMFLCHTFFLRYFLVDHLTGKFCPYLAFVLLLAASLVSSIVIERLKQLLGITMALKALKK